MSGLDGGFGSGCACASGGGTGSGGAAFGASGLDGGLGSTLGSTFCGFDGASACGGGSHNSAATPSGALVCHRMPTNSIAISRPCISSASPNARSRPFGFGGRRTTLAPLERGIASSAGTPLRSRCGSTMRVSSPA